MGQLQIISSNRTYTEKTDNLKSLPILYFNNIIMCHSDGTETEYNMTSKSLYFEPRGALILKRVDYNIR